MLDTRAGTGIQEGTHISFLYFSPIFLSRGQGMRGRGWDSGSGHTKGVLKVFLTLKLVLSSGVPAVGVISPGLKGHPLRPGPC